MHSANLLIFASSAAKVLGAYVPYAHGIELSIERRPVDQQNVVNVTKREVGSPLRNQHYEYIAQFEIGCPPQTVEATLDTGSSDLWVTGPGTALANVYNFKNSISAVSLDKKFSIQYVSGSARGDWITEDVIIGGVIVKNQQMAVVNSVGSQFTAGVFGIGFSADESTRSHYVNFPENLARQGYVSRNFYSLYLNSFNSSGGCVLFGATDPQRYRGRLTTVPMLSDQKFEIDVTLDGYGLEGDIQALLDSGTTLSYLPDGLADEIAQKFGAHYDPQGGYYRTAKPVRGVLGFIIGDTRILVPGEELGILDSYLGEPQDMQRPYIFGIARASDAANKIILGDTFLRSAYTVFDLDRKQISIAQSVNDCCGTDSFP